MELELTPEELAFRDEVRAFLAENLTPEVARAQRMGTGALSDAELAMPWHKALYKRGWVVPGWPVEHGGPGWTPTQRYIFEVECAMAGTPMVTPMSVRMVAPVLIGLGSPEQQRRYLPRILSGEDFWCQGYSEPGAGSDLASLKTRAVRDGDHYVINGTKIWTTQAQHADMMFALVRTADGNRKQEGITFVLIDMKTPGITIRPIYTIGGEHEVNQIFFDDVRVPVENRVGEEGQGWATGKYLLEFERGGGIASPRLRASLLKTAQLMREVWGDGPRDGQLERDYTTIETDIDALEMIEFRVLADLQAGRMPGPVASMLKLRASEIVQALTRLGVDLVGAAGLVWEPRRPLYAVESAGIVSDAVLPVVSAYLNARAQTIFGGTSEVQRDILARTMLGL